MKDPLNVCGVKNIKRYYFRELDNDYYVFGCKWNDCQFVTNNSGSIRRHVHNQHLCPHAINNNNANNSSNSSNTNRSSFNGINGSYSYNNSLNTNCTENEVNLPKIEIIELDSQAFSPGLINNSGEEIIDNPFAVTSKAININNEIEANLNRRSSGGLYSLKNYSELYSKVKIDGEVHFKCNCGQFTTKSQISLVRHIWSDIGRNVFECDIQGCDAKFDNEFNLYKHKKFDHNYDNNVQSVGKAQNIPKQANDQSFANFSHFEDKPKNLIFPKNDCLITVPQTISPLINKTQLSNSFGNRNDVKSIHTRTRRSSSGIYSLKNLSRHFRKVRVNDQLFYKCECGNFTTKSSVSLVRHIWVHKGVNSFECDLCDAKFDNESSLYRHRKFDHNSKDGQNFSNVSNTSNDLIYANAIQLSPTVSNITCNKFCDERNSSISNDSLKSDTQANSSSFISQLKPINLKKNYASDTRSKLGLYSLKNYGKYYKKFDVNGELCYKCTVCGFDSRSQVSYSLF
jgi:hypothetical protein